MGYAKSLLYNIGKHHGVGVCYIYARIPIYIGEIMCRGVHNLSYIYGNVYLISVKLYLSVCIHACISAYHYR